MKFTVTPLGGARRDVGRVVEGIVSYLQPKTTGGPPLDYPAPGGTPGPSRYYADSGEEPGRWLGHAAELADLHGDVRRDDFAAVLSGRDPHTGERLISAQGSAGRRSHLGAGNATRTAPDGTLLYGEADAAAVLGITKAEAARMFDVGAAVAADAIAAAVSGEGRAKGRVSGRVEGRVWASSQARASYLVPIIGGDGSRWVTEADLSACQTARENGVEPEEIRSAGAADDQLRIGEAARLAGVTTRYLRTLAKRYEDHSAEIRQTLEAGRRARRAYLVAHRGTRGQWLVTREHLAEFLERRHPPAVRVGFDVTLTTEKSLGVLALLGDPGTSRAVLGSIQDANDWAMAWLEDEAAYGRIDGKPVKAQGWMAASFRHLTSRALDPFPHHHNVVANTVTLADGSHRGLDTRGLYRHAHAASALATAEMRHQLSLRLGVRWRPSRKHGGWEIDGIDDRVIGEFSQRRSEIDDALRELEAEIGRGTHPNEIEHIVLRTRPAKSQTPAATLTDGWRQRATALGLDGHALEALAKHTLMVETPDSETVFSSMSAPDGICAGGSVFSRTEALAALANHPVPMRHGPPQPLLVGAARLETMADEFLTSRYVIQITQGEEPLFSTVEMLRLQERIATRFSKGLHQGAHLVPDSAVAAALAKHAHLTDEQRGLVESWCGAGHRYQAAIGRAGAGKTTTVAACADAWAARGYRVLGTAVKGEASRTLAAATGIECETVAWYLAHDDPQDLPLDARTILVIDEASTLSDRDLDSLMTMAATTGASVRLIGDPAQHGAVAAGGMFRVLCERHPIHTPELRTTHRVLDPDDRAAAQALREGRVDEALDRLEAAGHLHVVGDDLTMYRHVLGRWWDAHRDGQDHPMVDRRNSTRRQLNRLAHQLRQANGEIGIEELVASGERRFSVGDRVTARAPNRNLHPADDRHAYVRNGALGTIIALRPDPENRAQDTLMVDFDGIGTIELPRSFFDHHRTTAGRTEVGIDHAYALTSYAVQGSTRAVSTSRIDAATTRAETYVDITRGRHANHLYLTPATGPLDGETLPTLPARPADEVVAHRLQHSTGELTAWELAHPIDDGPQRGRAIGL